MINPESFEVVSAKTIMGSQNQSSETLKFAAFLKVLMLLDQVKLQPLSSTKQRKKEIEAQINETYSHE